LKESSPGPITAHVFTRAGDEFMKTSNHEGGQARTEHDSDDSFSGNVLQFNERPSLAKSGKPRRYAERLKILDAILPPCVSSPMIDCMFACLTADDADLKRALGVLSGKVKADE
jgi:hypothetical protein